MPDSGEVPQPKAVDRGLLLRNSGTRGRLFLSNSDLSRADHGCVDFVRQRESGVDAKVGMLGSDVLVGEILKCHARYGDTVNFHGIDVHLSLMTAGLCVSSGLDFMSAAEEGHQRIAGVAAASDLVEVNGGGGVNDAGLSLKLQ